MNKKLGLAVAGALLAASASAQAGIAIPAGDWTLDISGNVNAFYTYQRADNSSAATVDGGIASKAAANAQKGSTNINTGLLPAALGVGGKTRQNDLDVAFQFTFFPGISSNVASDAAFGSNSLNIRQVFLTFGDASWGSIKLGRDLGIYGSDAILSDMTLLGVGGLGGGSGTTTLGRIGAGYIYADWNAQVSYTSPNWNGFQLSAGVFDPWNSTAIGVTNGAKVSGINVDSTPQFQGKVTYDFAANDVSGRVWASALYQSFDAPAKNVDDAKAFDIGAKLSAAGAEIVGYYYSAEGVGTTGFGNGAHYGSLVNGSYNARGSDGGYVQVTYKLPTVGTKLGVAYGVSKLDAASGESATTLVKENNNWTVGAYHPLTKSLNLVAEYNRNEAENHAGGKVEDHGVSLGAILFF